MTILLRQKPLPQVVRQIVQRDNGAWLDASDMSTMYQDAAGTTPVTAMEQPVGLWLDKSQGLQLGPELVTNGDFSQGSAGWVLENGVMPAHVLRQPAAHIGADHRAENGRGTKHGRTNGLLRAWQSRGDDGLRRGNHGAARQALTHAARNHHAQAGGHAADHREHGEQRCHKQ